MLWILMASARQVLCLAVVCSILAYTYGTSRRFRITRPLECNGRCEWKDGTGKLRHGQCRFIVRTCIMTSARQLFCLAVVCSILAYTYGTSECSNATSTHQCYDKCVWEDGAGKPIPGECRFVKFWQKCMCIPLLDDEDV